jgi:hypothetical protein
MGGGLKENSGVGVVGGLGRDGIGRLRGKLVGGGRQVGGVERPSGLGRRAN